jgi:hypothetical protein
MDKVSKKSGRARHGKSNNASTLGQHRRVHKTLQPPLRTLPALRTVPWLSDVFPDMLWLCFTITRAANAASGMLLAARVLDCIDDVAPLVDGTLTSFDTLNDDERVQFLERLDQKKLCDQAFPPMFAHILALYAEAPARWLINPREDSGLTPDPALAGPALEGLIARNGDGQSAHATHAKAMILRALMKAWSADITTRAPSLPRNRALSSGVEAAVEAIGGNHRVALAFALGKASEVTLLPGGRVEPASVLVRDWSES